MADSICRELYKFPQHEFTVVLSSYLNDTFEALTDVPNLHLYQYDIKNSISTIIFGRDSFLDSLVKNNSIESVITVFGPSRWIPRVPHISGFALSQLLIPESPYFSILNTKGYLTIKLKSIVLKHSFKRSAHYFYTENPFISERLRLLFPKAKVYTVTNYYNQVFDIPEQWRFRKLPAFNGITLLTIATPYVHKNVTIAADVVRLLKVQYPELKVRFVFSFNKEDFHVDIRDIEDSFVFLGRVDISECPSLYEQSDIVFTPSLIECFTAAYPEAMRMQKPIITTDLEFAHGLCGNAATYYSALDPKSCAKAIVELSTNKDLRERIVNNGVLQLNKFDNYYKRAEKLVMLATSIK